MMLLVATCALMHEHGSSIRELQTAKLASAWESLGWCLELVF